MNGRPKQMRSARFFGARLDGELQVVAVVGHVEAVEGVAQLLQVEAARRMPLAARVALDDVDVGELERIDLLDQRQIDRLGI